MLSRLRPLKNLLPPALRRSRPKRQRATEDPDLAIRADLSVEDLFAALHDRGARYLVLRWFEQLPEVEGDLDLLISDKDVAATADLFESDPSGVPVDIYSVSGLPGTTYFRMPYLPPDKAAGMLDRRRWFRDLCFVPGEEDHLLSLAYHAVYQKGLKSGLPTDQQGLEPASTPKHDYAGELARLGAAVGVPIEPRMEEVEAFVAQRGWRPSPERLAVLARHNAWLAANLRNDGDQ